MEKEERGNHGSPVPPCRWIETLQCQDLQKYLPRFWDPIPYICISVRGLTGRSGEYPVSPMDLNRNCCLHRAIGLSPGMDHLADTAFFFILPCLSSSCLPACCIFFLFLLSHPCQKLFVSVGIIQACVHHPHQHTSSS